MSLQSPPPDDARGQSRAVPQVPVPGARGTSGWVVVTALAALLLVLLGTFHLAVGLSALLTDDRSPLGAGQLLTLSTTAWSWLNLAVGAVVLVAGVLVLAGRPWARAVGVVVSLLSAASALSLFDAHPGWAVTVMVFDLLVVLALTVHGSEIRAG